MLNQRPPVYFGISIRFPERGGHSISQVLLINFAGIAITLKCQAVTIFPLFCLIDQDRRTSGS